MTAGPPVPGAAACISPRKKQVRLADLSLLSDSVKDAQFDLGPARAGGTQLECVGTAHRRPSVPS